jgi:Membrane dipeptidase (Peptidase family M19)
VVTAGGEHATEHAHHDARHPSYSRSQCVPGHRRIATGHTIASVQRLNTSRFCSGVAWRQASLAHLDYDPWGGNYAEVVTGDVRSPRRALRDFNCYPQMLNLVDRLLAGGYTDGDVHKILGGNFLRVLDEV